ncbi:MAG: hypothetical protein ACXU8U_00155 [Asticcacaulis sp.]
MTPLRAPEIRKPDVRDIETSPDGLPGDGAAVAVRVEIDWQDKFLDLSERYEALRIDYNEYKRRENANDILNELIVPYSRKIFRFMVGYCAFVGVILLLDVFCPVIHPLSDTVMSFLVGSTATTVLGLVGMIVSGIFTGARRNAH